MVAAAWHLEAEPAVAHIVAVGGIVGIEEAEEASAVDIGIVDTEVVALAVDTAVAVDIVVGNTLDTVVAAVAAVVVAAAVDIAEEDIVVEYRMVAAVVDTVVLVDTVEGSAVAAVAVAAVAAVGIRLDRTCCRMVMEVACTVDPVEEVAVLGLAVVARVAAVTEEAVAVAESVADAVAIVVRKHPYLIEASWLVQLVPRPTEFLILVVVVVAANR